MRITGNEHKLNEIRMVHKGQDFNYHIQFFDANNEYDSIIASKMATIEFGDLHEVNELINMLQEFKRKCELGIGCWKNRKGEY